MQDRFSASRDATRNDLSKDLLRAVSGRDVNAQLPVVARTRRAIRVADENRREQGERERRTLGISLFTGGALLVLLAPVLWDSVDDLFGGEHFSHGEGIGARGRLHLGDRPYTGREHTVFDSERQSRGYH